MFHHLPSPPTCSLPPSPNTDKRAWGEKKKQQQQQKKKDKQCSHVTKKPTQGTRTEERDKDWLQNATPSSLPRGGKSSVLHHLQHSQSAPTNPLPTSGRHLSPSITSTPRPARTQSNKSEKHWKNVLERVKRKAKRMDDEPSPESAKKAMTHTHTRVIGIPFAPPHTHPPRSTRKIPPQAWFFFSFFRHHATTAKKKKKKKKQPIDQNQNPPTEKKSVINAKPLLSTFNLEGHGCPTRFFAFRHPLAPFPYRFRD